MVRESLPLLIVLLVPLAGMAGLLPAGGRETGGALPVAVDLPTGNPARRPVLLPPTAKPPVPVAGVWLNF